MSSALPVNIPKHIIQNSELNIFEKYIYGIIEAEADELGYVEKKNDDLSKIYQVGRSKLTATITKLTKLGFLIVDNPRHSSRKIWLTDRKLGAQHRGELKDLNKNTTKKVQTPNKSNDNHSPTLPGLEKKDKIDEKKEQNKQKKKTIYNDFKTFQAFLKERFKDVPLPVNEDFNIQHNLPFDQEYILEENSEGKVYIKPANNIDKDVDINKHISNDVWKHLYKQRYTLIAELKSAKLMELDKQDLKGLKKILDKFKGGVIRTGNKDNPTYQEVDFVSNPTNNKFVIHTKQNNHYEFDGLHHLKKLIKRKTA